MKRLTCIIGVAVMVCAPALGASSLDTAARALRSDPVYVAANASPTITASEAKQLRASIRRSDMPIFIAVLNEAAISEAHGADALPRALANKTGRGAFGVIAGKNFRAAASTNIGLDPGEAGRLATRAFEGNYPSNNGGRVYPMLAAWVRAVQTATQGSAYAHVPFEDQPRFIPREMPYEEARRIPAGRPEGGSTILPIAIMLVVIGAAVSLVKGLSGAGSFGGISRPSTFRRRTTFLGDRERPEQEDIDRSWFGLPRDGASHSSFDDDRSAGRGSWGGSSSTHSSGGSSGFDSSHDSGGGSW